VAMSVAEGHAPAAEAVDTELAKELNAITDTFDRQLHLLAWFYGRYKSCLPENRIVKYEDVIATGGRSLRAVTPLAESLAEPLSSRNRNPAYGQERLEFIRRRLAEAPEELFLFYSRQESIAS